MQIWGQHPNRYKRIETMIMNIVWSSWAAVWITKPIPFSSKARDAPIFVSRTIGWSSLILLVLFMTRMNDCDEYCVWRRAEDGSLSHVLIMLNETGDPILGRVYVCTPHLSFYFHGLQMKAFIYDRWLSSILLDPSFFYCWEAEFVDPRTSLSSLSYITQPLSSHSCEMGNMITVDQ